METYGEVSIEEYVEMVTHAILGDTPNGETREDLHMGAVKRMADYYYFQGYDFDELRELKIYGTYDILKYTLDEIAEEIDRTAQKSADNWRKISGI